MDEQTVTSFEAMWNRARPHLQAAEALAAAGAYDDARQETVLAMAAFSPLLSLLSRSVVTLTATDRVLSHRRSPRCEFWN